MLALLALLPALASAQSAPSRVTAKANLPTSSNGSVTFDTGNGTAWTTSNASTVTLGTSPVGWRIAGNADSEILYNVSPTYLRDCKYY